jgi:hypothetical protein
VNLNRRKPRRGFAALLVAWLAAAPAAAQTGTYLFAIPVEPATDMLPLGDVIDVALEVPDPARGAQLVEAGGALELLGNSGDKLTIRLGTQPTLAAGPGGAHRAPSFVIDFDEAAVDEALRELRDAAGENPTLPALGDFVAGYIDDKNYRGSFDLASRVAETRSGDCTEHAVLLAALARALGLPARVVIWVVLVETPAGVQAFGHAWAEVHSGSGWLLADATQPADEPGVVRARYLPFIALEDEGPGYAMDLMRIAAVQPSKITILGNASLDAI